MATQAPGTPPEIEATATTTVIARPGIARRSLIGLALIAALALLAYSSAGTLPDEGGHIGFWSILPAICTLALVFVTREVISSLIFGILIGGLVSGQYNLLGAFILPSIGSSSYALILVVYLWALGGLIGLWTRTGGALAFAQWAGRTIVRGPRSARFFGWLLGVVFHQGGTISTILAGTTLRPVADEHRLSKEELTYIVDSTASPVAAIIPFNAWPLYVGGLVVGTIPLFATEADALAFFFKSIPYNFYAIFALASTFLFSLGMLPWVGKKMRQAMLRSQTTGQLNAPGSRPLVSDELTNMRIPDDYRSSVADFVVPMGTLLLIAIVPYFVIKKVMIAEAFGIAVIVAILLAVVKGMPLSTAIEGFVDGCKGVTVGAIILGLAVTLGNVSKALGTANYIVEVAAAHIHPVVLPGLLTFICMVVAFSIGSSWGTYAVVFPIAMPLAYALNPDPQYIMLAFGAVMGGALYGDQCSPISDTTILSALACGGDLMDHVSTQMPLATVAAVLASITSMGIAMLI